VPSTRLPLSTATTSPPSISPPSPSITAGRNTSSSRFTLFANRWLLVAYVSYTYPPPSSSRIS
jgi:hypothetical protein